MQRHVMGMLGLLVVAFLLPTMPAARAQPRTEVALAEGWRFHLGDAPAGAIAPGFDDGSWERVSVPHTWNRLGSYELKRRADANVVRGVGWYRLRFLAPADLRQKRVFLQFDAASIVAEVWLNGRRLGAHAGAFSRFRFDATNAVREGDNMLVVKVDNSKPDPGSPTQYVVPISGDFFMYGGLYRPVSLLVTGERHVDLLDHGGPGTYANATSLTDQAAEVSVLARLRNDGSDATDLTVRTRIADATGREVARDERTLRLAPGAAGESRAALRLTSPRRWNGPADPYLYRTIVEVVDKGRVTDRVTQPLGLRTVAIDPAHGFILNGRPMQLHGVTRHQDRQDKGWALSLADHEEDMALIREIGANSVRLSHYNHAEPFDDLADRYGVILWAELGLVNLASIPGQADTPPEMRASAEQQLIELIRQNYNHPSVAVWSIGNEITNWSSKGLTPSNARPLMTALDALAHREDPTRPTTIAVCCEPLPGDKDDGRDRTSGTADTVAYNLYLGWYGSGHAEEAAKLGGVLTGLHRERPGLPIGVGEYGAGGAVTQHTDNPFGGRIESISRPQPEEVQAAVHELSWKGIAPLDFLWGSWVWQMFDATSDLREEGDSFDINTKGLVTFDRKTRKDAFYFYKAAWSDRPVLYLTGRRYVDRAYPMVDVRAYSNAASATLSLNGQPVGTARCADHVCVWPGVRLRRGENRLEAVAGGVTDRITWRYDGREDALHVRTGTLTGVTLGDGTRYGSDDFFSGGTGFTLNPFRRELYASGTGKPANPPKIVTGTATPELYASWRGGQRFGYALPLPDGDYRVTLHLFDPVETAAGKRVFTVTASGGERRRIDPVALAGAGLKAVTVELPATAKDGRLTLDFAADRGEALVSAIDVVRR
ncbi:beta galactosidase jelly roll domain-containing protein [Sphingomonas cannabina]|uniref:glycoside hydrolase family 2 TIM barrel-domain containing protein n=1 Tax=Sphingomonas cannabina TaxID=2899123 RepID=UPI001F331FDB|nr:glycoside hydrolase family 2 TIM barrel-domain containing protein [Sphingomonas cannabina]UIJ45326.1 beta galactosidase jelly roll domain-containing protein [Sphingomonas cannabina]